MRSQKTKPIFDLSCSKGSFLRAFAHHLGQKTKTGACLSQLQRLTSGKFKVEDSITIPNLKEKLRNLTEDTDLKKLLEILFSRAQRSPTSISRDES